MAAWRRRALEHFPQLRAELQDSDYSIYMLFFDLLPVVREAHDAADSDFVAEDEAVIDPIGRDLEGGVAGGKV